MISRATLVLAVVAVVAAVVAGTAVAQTPSRRVEVTNLPRVQSVTGDELRISQWALALLLLRMYGALPAGVVPPEIDECLVTDVGEFVVHGARGGRTGVSACGLAAYAEACVSAASQLRRDCGATCSQFLLISGDGHCQGRARPVIEPFSESKHCYFDPRHGSTVSCTATGWCLCSP